MTTSPWQMSATRHHWTYVQIRFERTITGGKTPVTTSETNITAISRPITGDFGMLQGEARNFDSDTETTTQYFKILGRVIPMSFTYTLKTTQFNGDGTTTDTYSDPITFTVPDAADEYAFTIPVPGKNQVVGFDWQTTTFPA